MTGLRAATRRGVLAAASAIWLTTAAYADDATLEAGRGYTEQFQKGSFDELWERMSDEMKTALQSPQSLADVHETLAAQVGEETSVLSETSDEQGGLRIYLRTAQHENTETPVITQFALDEEDRIYGFFVRPAQDAAESRFLDYETKADLRLPFEGRWTVVWGGRTPNLNYHAVVSEQRFASDFLIQLDGSTHKGEGLVLEDYHCWDRPILAPARGAVVAAENALPDQPIGEMDPEKPAGNHVVLDLGNDEYLFLAHLKQGSVEVKVGDTVESGQQIGTCGNSGNTSEPHLHVHMQNTPDLTKGEGLPAFFNRYVADGEAVERGEPQQGQVIEPADDD
ncbi:peptidoglycan DD-metalloendopeptidase family protein [Mesorhizobium sp. CAU 1732]|uniref:M23 family metallopeptidase n=1 Tax=Mesorhizobium sp. CAU 1732 TaxID=3140358 RepID=UPI0032618C8D